LYIVSEDDFLQILNEEDIKDVLLMKDPPLLQDVAFLLQEWKPVARYLNLDEPTIRRIAVDNRNDYNEQKYQCLNEWVKSNGKKATLVTLLRIMYFRLKDKSIISKVAQCQRGMYMTSICIT